MGEALAEGEDALVERLEVDLALFLPRGEERGLRRGEVVGVDVGQAETRVHRLLQRQRVVAVAAGDGLERGRVVAGPLPRPHQPAGEIGLADAGVGSGDEEVHEEL
ncbi:MAG: hypothetical protein WDO13_17695 [Verrucomicrobiota bacterium]